LEIVLRSIKSTSWNASELFEKEIDAFFSETHDQ
jgi:hypothetical protein